MIKRVFYAWFDEKENVFRLSFVAPDGPVRPSLALDSKADVDEYARRKRAKLLWYPPIHEVRQGEWR